MIHLLGLTVAAALAAPRLPFENAVGPEDVLWGILFALCFPKIMRSALVVPALAWLTVLSLSIAGGFLISAYGPASAPFLTLAKAFEVVTTALIARAVVKDAADFETLVRWAAGGVAVLGAVGIADAVVHRDDIRAAGPLPFRIFNGPGYVGQTNHVAGAIAILAPLLLAGRRRLAMLLGFAVVFIAGSRGALLALGEGLLVWTILERRWKSLGVVAAAFAVLLTCGPTARRLSYRSWEWAMFRDSMDRRHLGFAPAHTDTRNRFAAWWTSLDEFRRAPVLGTGLGSRHRAFYESAYVQTIAETGLAGVCAVAFFGIAVVRMAYGLAPPWRAAMIACVAAFAVFGIGAVVTVITRVAIPFWAMVGAAEGAKENTPAPT